MTLEDILDNSYMLPDVEVEARQVLDRRTVGLLINQLESSVNIQDDRGDTAYTAPKVPEQQLGL